MPVANIAHQAGAKLGSLLAWGLDTVDAPAWPIQEIAVTCFDCDIPRARAGQIRLMGDTVAILGHILAGVDRATATTLRDPNDGAKGWTVTEVVCHLRDFDGFFHDRVQRMLAATYPALPRYDHEALAVERRYNDQDVHQVYADLAASRRRFIETFRSLDEAQWQRTGVHPERGRFTLYDALLQVGAHDALHLEQIGRILGQQIS